MPLTSMTGFADRAGEADGVAWTWEARSVNGRGLDLRVRLPEGFEAAEQPLRAAITAAAARGSISVGLRVAQGARSAAPRLNPAALAAAVEAALAAAEAASTRGLDLAPMTAADLLSLRGVVEAEAARPGDMPGVVAAMAADAAALAAGLKAAREVEGAALARVLAGQLDRIEALAAAARLAAEARAPRLAEALKARVEALLAGASGLGASGLGEARLDEGRLAQELAVLAVRMDVTEELDRLAAHVAAGRALLAAEGPVGRKLDFLAQEFNREVNTLCSKAQAAELTAIGLEMKVAVDQLREQVQNVE